jgi:voltage-gated potassium channel
VTELSRGTVPPVNVVPMTHDPDRLRSQLRLDARLSLLALLAVPAAALELWADGDWARVGGIVQAALWALFVVLTVVEIAVAGRDGVRFRRLGAIAVLALSNPWAPPAYGALLGVRALRYLRIRRVLSVEATEAVEREVFSARGLGAAAAAAGLLLLVLGWLFELVEVDQDLTVGDGVWFALVTAATVGYGDIVPTTTGGRVIATVLMIVGIAFAGLLTGALAERFTRKRMGEPTVDDRLAEMSARLERMEAALRSGRPD